MQLDLFGGEPKSLLILILEIATIVIVSLGFVKWTVIKLLKENQETLQGLIDSQSKQIDNIKTAYWEVEIRVLGLEYGHEEKSHRLDDQDNEIKLLEETIDVTMSALLNQDAHGKIVEGMNDRRSQLRDLRLRSKQKRTLAHQRNIQGLLHAIEHSKGNKEMIKGMIQKINESKGDDFSKILSNISSILRG